MNALLLIGIIFALSGFKPKQSTEKSLDEPLTQGYYTPALMGWGKKKMNTNANLGAWPPNYDSSQIERGTYYVADNSQGIAYVFYKSPSGVGMTVEPYDASRYKVGDEGRYT
jgi:hypothetical protein